MGRGRTLAKSNGTTTHELGALVMLAMKVGNLGTYNMSETYQLHAYFSNIGGLKTKASIKSAGVLVGRVTRITLDTMAISQCGDESGQAL